jgi:hypothetical protein
MRSTVVSPLIALLAAFACAPDGPDPDFVEDFVGRSPTLACADAGLQNPPAGVVRVRALTDSLLGVIAMDEGAIILLDSTLRERLRITFDEEGPGSLHEPTDLLLHGDSLLVVAEQGRARLRFFGLDGRETGALPLGFLPYRLAPYGQGWLVSAQVLSPGQADRLYVVSEGGAEPLGVLPVHMADWQLKGFANMTVIEPLGAGRFVQAHQMFHPLATVFDSPAPGGEPGREVALPLPDGVRAVVGIVPQRPFTDAALMGSLAPVLDAASDTTTGTFLFTTRTGRSLRGFSEKALVRTDRDLRLVDSFLFEENVAPFALLPGGDAVLVVAEDERWFRCTLPELPSR